MVAGAVTHVNNTNSVNAALPAGVLPNERLVLFTGHGWVPSLPSGWTQLDSQSGANVNGLICTRIATQAVVDAGVVAVSFSNSFYGSVGIVNLPAGSVRETVAVRSGGTSSSSVLSTVGAAGANDLAVYFGFNRAASNNTFNRGTALAASNAASASAALAVETVTTPGIVSTTFSRSVAGDGYYDAIVLVRSLFVTAAPVLGGGYG